MTKKVKPFTPGCLQWLERDNDDEYAQIKATQERKRAYAAISHDESEARRKRANAHARFVSCLVLAVMAGVVLLAVLWRLGY